MTAPEHKRVLEVVMKTCPVCGLDVEDSYLFCPDDGARLIEEPLAPVAPEPTPAPAQESPVSSPEYFVLYCGECNAEYPMTFAECPVHQVPLTRQRIETIPAQAPVADLAYEEVSSRRSSGIGAQVQAPVAETAVDERQAKPREAQAELEEPKSYASDASDVGPLDAEISTPAVVVPLYSPKPRSSPSRGSTRTPSVLFVDDLAQEHDIGSSSIAKVKQPAEERSSFRVVAALMVVALVVFCVVAVYTFFSRSGGRRVETTASTESSVPAGAEPPAFIATPESALEFKEEPAKVDDTVTAKPDQTSVAPVAGKRPQSPERNAQVGPAAADRSQSSPVKPARAPASTTAPATATSRDHTPARPLPAGDPGRVDARLVRVRSTRTVAGVRYELTFSLQDESGRHTQWQRLLISTRAASGASRSEAIPFRHRLGAGGALTFTVRVEMNGRSASDLQGRIVCTTFGSDIDGRLLSASFGANVAP